MKNVYIIDGYRTAIGSLSKSLLKKTCIDLGVSVVSALLKKNNLIGREIDEVIFGNVLSAGNGQNIARQIAVHSCIPVEKTAMTINMVCASGLRAVSLAAQAIKCGDADLIMAGGTESMSNAPYLLKKARNGYRLGNSEIIDSLVHDGLWEIFNNYHMGMTAENIAEKYRITRKEQDEFALLSQQKCEKAINEGKFKDEIIPVILPGKKGETITFDTDEHPRSGLTAGDLEKLKSVFKDNGTVTAGNSSGINDGAACLLLAGEEGCKKYGLKPLARIVSYAYHGTEPSIMGIGPVEAVKKALIKANWTLDDLELIEANEAFASQSISVNRELAWDAGIINVNGGAIALGHPIGATGARLLVTLIHEMKKQKVKKGLTTLCIGGGMGMALCVEMEK